VFNTHNRDDRPQYYQPNSKIQNNQLFPNIGILVSSVGIVTGFTYLIIYLTYSIEQSPS